MHGYQLEGKKKKKKKKKKGKDINLLHLSFFITYISFFMHNCMCIKQEEDYFDEFYASFISS
jgi:hypothetical protein